MKGKGKRDGESEVKKGAEKKEGEGRDKKLSGY